MLHFQKENLTVFRSVLYKTTTAVIETEEAIILTDPNWLPDEIKQIKEFINERIKQKQLIIIYTHSDFDHIIGAAAFPEATVIASEAFHNNPKKQAIIQECEAFDQQYYIERDYIHQYPTVDHVISKDGQRLILGEVTLAFYLSPGHTSDGLFTVIEPLGILLAGDYLSDVEFPFVYSGYDDYLKTLDKAKIIMTNFDLKVLVPGHGNVTTSKQEMWDRVDFSNYYLTQLLDNPNLENECREKYSFFEGMKDSHINNIEQAQKERS